jgi:hypothetical protein
MRGKSFVIFITPEQSLYDDLATPDTRHDDLHGLP